MSAVEPGSGESRFGQPRFGEPNSSCATVGPLLFFYVCGEITDQERVLIEEHVAICAPCKEQLITEHALQTDISSLPQASEQLDTAGILLAQCRSELFEKIDDLSAPPAKEKWLSFFWLRRWMSFHPAWSAALLVLFGLVFGIQGTQWLTGLNNAVAVGQAVNVRPSVKLSDDQLAKMAVAGVNLTPSPSTGKQWVRVQLSAQQPLELTGSPDDDNVRQVLTFILQNGQRFNAGVRQDCLEALKARSCDPAVRVALLAAARKDQNPAVRMKALEALRDSASDRMVREALLDALHHDSNPGVRVEAVNLLVRSLETPYVRPPNGNMVVDSSLSEGLQDAKTLDDVIRSLEELQRTDPSQYVRLRSSAALREIGDRTEQ